MNQMEKDRTFCQGNGCEVKEECGRYLEKPYYLYTSLFPKTPGHDKSCPYYLESL